MHPSDLTVRRTIPLLLVATALLLLWVGLTVAGPFFLSHPPGEQNPSFWWYLIYESFPIVFFLTLFALLFCAWRLWTRGRIELRSTRRSP
jgi:TRAP-type C4-dicarboxylate transport system permease small subunit